VPEPGEEANVPISYPIIEPAFKDIEKSEKAYPLKVSAVADYARFSVDVKDIFFKPTFMYSSRVHQFKIKNSALIKLNFSNKLVLFENDAPLADKGYFSVEPKQGAIAPGSEEEFTVRFAPTEVSNSN